MTDYRNRSTSFLKIEKGMKKALEQARLEGIEEGKRLENEAWREKGILYGKDEKFAEDWRQQGRQEGRLEALRDFVKELVELNQYGGNEKCLELFVLRDDFENLCKKHGVEVK